MSRLRRGLRGALRIFGVALLLGLLVAVVQAGVRSGTAPRRRPAAAQQQQAVLAHQLLRGRVLLPVHWGPSRSPTTAGRSPSSALRAADAAGTRLVIPKPGQSFDPAAPPVPARWWPELPWIDAQKDPIVSSQMN